MIAKLIAHGRDREDALAGSRVRSTRRSSKA